MRIFYLSSLIASSGSKPAVAALTLFTFLLKVANLNLVSDLSSYFSCLGLKVLTEARNLEGEFTSIELVERNLRIPKEIHFDENLSILSLGLLPQGFIF